MALLLATYFLNRHVILALLVVIVNTNDLRTFYMSNYCGKVLDMEKENVKALKLEETEGFYYQNMHCYTTIMTRSDLKLIIRFNSFDISSLRRCEDYLTVRDSDGEPFKELNIICGTTLPGVHVTSGNRVRFLFHSDDFSQGLGIDVLITAFHNEPCNNKEYRCPNGRCISGELSTFKYDHCGTGAPTTLIWIILGGVIGGVLVVIVIAVVVFFVCRRRRRQPPRQVGLIPGQGPNPPIYPPGYPQPPGQFGPIPGQGPNPPIYSPGYSQPPGQFGPIPGQGPNPPIYPPGQPQPPGQFGPIPGQGPSAPAYPSGQPQNYGPPVNAEMPMN